MAAGAILFLQDMAVVLAVAAVTTVIFHRFRLPVVLGYLLAGMIVGPHTPPFAFVRDIATIEILGEVGVVFLLFALGLEFDLRKLRRVGVTAVLSGLVQAFLMVWVGYTVGKAFGLDTASALVLGAAVSISSTVIIAKVLEEQRRTDEEWAQIVFGILIVEDLVAVVFITIAASGGAFSAAELGALGLRLLVFVAVALGAGLLVVPRLVARVSRMPGEVLVITAVALAFGLSLLGAYLGFSPALGAFIMGGLVAESGVVRAVEGKILPIRDLFTAIFFVAIGMLVDPAAVVAHGPLVIAVTAAVIVGKVVAASFATFLTGHGLPTSLRVGFGLAQVGEFSFVIAGAAAAAGLTRAPLEAVLVSVAVVTAFTTPWMIRRSDAAARAVARRAPRAFVTYAELYGAWVTRLGERLRGPRATRRLLRLAVGPVVLGGAIVGLVVLGSFAATTVGRLLGGSRTGLALSTVGWIAIGLLLLPLGGLFARALAKLVDAAGAAALPSALAASPTGAGVHLALRRTFVFAGVLFLALVLVAVATPVLPAGPVLALAAVAVAAAGLLLYDALVRLQRRIDAVVARTVGDSEEVGPERESFLAVIREAYPWGATIREVVVPARSAVAGRTLGQLALRTRTGASVVALEGAGGRVLHPDPDLPLEAGDVLVLIGDAPQVEAASHLIAAGGHGSLGAVVEVRLSAGGALAGRSLAAARLRETTGATVAGILRRGGLLSPTAELVLEPEDVLLVVGDAGQVEAVRRLAR